MIWRLALRRHFVNSGKTVVNARIYNLRARENADPDSGKWGELLASEGERYYPEYFMKTLRQVIIYK